MYSALVNFGSIKRINPPIVFIKVNRGIMGSAAQVGRGEMWLWRSFIQVKKKKKNHLGDIRVSSAWRLQKPSQCPLQHKDAWEVFTKASPRRGTWSKTLSCKHYKQYSCSSVSNARLLHDNYEHEVEVFSIKRSLSLKIWKMWAAAFVLVCSAHKHTNSSH